MCGRYYVDDDTAKEIERLVRDIDAKLKKEKRLGDIRPSDKAAVLTGDFKCAGSRLLLAEQRWGFPSPRGNGIIINARTDTVMEKRMFRTSIMEHRCIIPASGFYEWNRAKEKVSFLREDRHVLFMAGFYNRFEDEDCFVILTTAANDSVSKTHDRMPLILERDELTDWIYDDRRLNELLLKTPVMLESKAEFEQQTLLF